MNILLPALSLAAAFEAEQTGTPYPNYQEILQVEQDVSQRTIWLRKFYDTLNDLDMSQEEWNLYRAALIFSWPEYIFEDLAWVKKDALTMVNAWRLLRGQPEDDSYTVNELRYACEERQKYDANVPIGNVLAYWQDAAIFQDVEDLPLLRLFVEFGEYETMNMMYLIGLYEDAADPEFRLTILQQNPSGIGDPYYAVAVKDDARPDLIAEAVENALDYLDIDVCAWLSLCKFYPYSPKALFFLLYSRTQGLHILSDYLEDPNILNDIAKSRADSSEEWLSKNRDKLK